MKIRLILLLLLFSFAGTAYSQTREPLAAYKKDSLWHFLDYEGKEMFPPVELVNIGGYSEGYFLVIKKIGDEDKWGFMNLLGQIAVHDADQLRRFRDGMAMTVRSTDIEDLYYFGFLDQSGKETIPPVWIDATDFQEGYAWVMNKDKRGYVNKQGELAIAFDADVFGLPFSEGYAPMTDENYNWGFIDRNGNYVIKPEYDEVGNFSEGLAMVTRLGKWGYIDKSGKLIIKFGYDYAREFSGGVAFVGAPDGDNLPMWGIIDKNTTMNVDFIYKDCKNFSEGIGLALYEGKWRFIDPYGKKIVEQEFDAAQPFKKGLALVHDAKSAKTGFIDPSGDFQLLLPEADIYVDLRWSEILRK